MLARLARCRHRRLCVRVCRAFSDEAGHFTSDGMELTEAAGRDLLVRLAQNDVTHVYLRRAKIGDRMAVEICKGVAQNRSVTMLDLRENDLTEASGRSLRFALRDNSTLESLKLGGNVLNCEGVKILSKALKSHTSLSSLSLDDNAFGDDGAASLADALRTNNRLVELNCANNHLTDAGFVQICDALLANHSLTLLNCKANYITWDGVAALEPALSSDSPLQNIDIGRQKNNACDFVHYSDPDLQARMYKESEMRDLSKYYLSRKSDRAL